MTRSNRRGEGHVDAVLVLRQTGDGVAEHELGVLRARRLQDRGERATGKFDAAAAGRARERAQVDAADTAARRVHEPHSRHVGDGGPQPGEHSHPLRHPEGLATHVHGAAAGSLPQPALDHRRSETVPRQPVRERRTGDAGTGDERRPVAHASSAVWGRGRSSRQRMTNYEIWSKVECGV